MRHIKITVAYDGTHYRGWQRQKNGITVEETLENAIKQSFNEEVKLIGASRTDTGVHAKCQTAVFGLQLKSIPVDRIPNAINAHLPKDIVVRMAEEVNADFHPRYEAKKKTYTYQVFNEAFPMPQYRNYMAFEREKLNIDAMRKAAPYFVGTKDFKSFCAAGSSVKTTVRTIYQLDVDYKDSILTITITGNGFLYNMVRIIVGTLLEVGKEKIGPERVKDIIEARDRSKACKTAPACGLTLTHIDYH